MTAVPPPIIPTRPGSLPTKPNWRRAAACWRGMIFPHRHHDQTYEIFLSLGAPTFARAFQAVRAHPDGRRLLAGKPDLLAKLGDDAYLASLPPGSLGHAYRDFLTRHRLDAGVFDETTAIAPIAERNGWDGDFYYMIKRGTALHDIFHTLGGYGPDVGGELGNLGFHHGQLGKCWFTRTLALLMCLIPMDIPVRHRIRYLNQAIQRGRHADNLMAAPYEQLLDQPIDQVRQQLGITPTTTAHPQGHLFTRWQPPFTKTTTNAPPQQPWIYQPHTPPPPS